MGVALDKYRRGLPYTFASERDTSTSKNINRVSTFRAKALGYELPDKMPSLEISKFYFNFYFLGSCTYMSITPQLSVIGTTCTGTDRSRLWLIIYFNYSRPRCVMGRSRSGEGLRNLVKKMAPASRQQVNFYIILNINRSS